MRLLNKTFILLLFIFTSVTIFADSILEKLQNENPTKIIPMHEHLNSLDINASYTSDVYYLEFEDGLKAVFKTYNDDDENRKQNEAELISYQLATALGLDFIPKTCIRTLEIDSIIKTGCIKEYIDIQHTEKFNNEEHFVSFLENYAQQNKQNLEKINALRIFYFILGQYDCSHHNLLITKNNENYYFHAIDNGEIHKKLYVQLGDAPFTPRGYVEDDNSFQRNFPFDAVEEFTSPLVKNIQNRFLDKDLPKYFIMNLENFEKHNPSKMFPIVHYKNVVWMQLQGRDIDFFWKKITNCPAFLKEKIASWIKNPDQLDNLFKKISFYDKTYKDLLFNRLNQVLELPN